MVERELPKLEVASSSLVARSTRLSGSLKRVGNEGSYLFEFGTGLPEPQLFGRDVKVGFARFFLCLNQGVRRSGGARFGAMSDTVIERLREYIDSLLPAMGLELFDIQYRREGHGWVLRLIVDKPEGVTLDDCSQVSRETSDFLDVEDLIDHPYHLEVSSPGLERPLRSVEECGRHLGKKARFKLSEEIDGQRVIIGDLQAIKDNTISVVTDEGQTYSLLWDTIVKARLTL